MTDKKAEKNKRALEASRNTERKNLFLTEERDHILYLTARILRKTVTDSDDEFSIALMAVSEALDSYDEDKGAFWNYASLVIKSRILDEYRKRSSYDRELLISPDSFTGEARDTEKDAEISIRTELSKKTAVYIDNSLRDELDMLNRELRSFDIDLFDLPQCSPKSEKTKRTCRELISAFFLPPPLTELLRKTGKLPVSELLKRSHASRKLIDRHRKFIVASILIKDGDYKEISEYL